MQYQSSCSPSCFHMRVTASTAPVYFRSTCVSLLAACRRDLTTSKG